VTILADIIEALDRIPVWKRLQGAPAKIDELENRIAELEKKLGDKWPADVCKFCGERAMRMSQSYAPQKNGNVAQQWHCGKCGQYENRVV
jgi:uncharacterized protein with PIN domain